MNSIKLSITAVLALYGSMATAEVVDLGDVSISASKIEQSTLEAPVNVTVLTADSMAKTNTLRIGDALNAKVPGLYIRGGALGNSRPGATMSISMRGQGGVLTKSAILVDGMNMADAYSGQVNWSMITMDDVDRVEVVPGVGSSLYGSNAMGGVISITTKSPTKEEMSFNIGKGYGDAAGDHASALYRNKFKNGLGVVFGVSENYREGYIAEYVTKTPTGTPAGGAVVVNGATQTTTTAGATTYIVGDKGTNASMEKNIHAKLYYDLSPTSTVNAGFAYSDSESLNRGYNSYLTDTSGNPILIGTTATSLNLNGQATTIKEQDFAGSIPMGNTALRYFAGYDGKIGESKLSLNFGKIDREYWSSAIGATATLTSGAGTMNTSPNSTTNASAQLTTPIGDSHLLITGVATEVGRLHQKKYAVSNWTDMDTKTAELDRIDARSMTNSLFLQDQIVVNDDLLLYVGGRYDMWKAGGVGVVTTGSVPGTFNYDDRSESAFSPKVAAVYMLNNRTSIKSSIGTGFRAPTNYYLFANPTFSGNAAPNGKMIYSNPNLKPEKAKAFDLGVEYHFVDGGKAMATCFATKTTDLIYQKITKVPQYTDPIINKVVDYIAQQENTGEALAKGIELSGEYPLADWLSVMGSYSYTDSKITKDNTNTGMVGKRVTNVPKDMVTLAFMAERGDWSGVLSGRHIGEVYSNNDNSDVVKGVWTGYSKYTVIDLKTNYQINKNFIASLMVDNLFDKEYYEYYRMPGRGVTINLSANF
ncbi:MAG: TonB-dependent receptor [Sulfuricurvum sp.]|nr:TonB-dependent receptor [Sulfuricurvum sp.]